MEDPGSTILGFVILLICGFFVWVYFLSIPREMKRKESLRKASSNRRGKSWFSEPWK